MGPIGVVEKLVKFLPRNIFDKFDSKNIHPVSSAPFGSASILAISYAYIAMMGSKGLTDATRLAILNANYIRSRLESHFDILYKGVKGTSAHEFIIDCRDFKSDTNVEVEDIAKRLMDFGYHAPTVSFPVPGTMILPYTREKAAYPLSFVSKNKFWPSVRRVDNAHGDRNLFCSCIPMEEYSS